MRVNDQLTDSAVFFMLNLPRRYICLTIVTNGKVTEVQDVRPFNIYTLTGFGALSKSLIIFEYTFLSSDILK
jgi:hypothetical protein